MHVPYAIPGEKILARIYRNYKNYSSADCISVLEPSPNRVSPQCSLFGECGGCQYQHLDYKYQLDWKRNQVKDSFARIADINFEINPTIASPQQYGYRSKPLLILKTPSVPPFQIGFLQQEPRRSLFDVDHCQYHKLHQ